MFFYISKKKKLNHCLDFNFYFRTLLLNPIEKSINCTKTISQILLFLFYAEIKILMHWTVYILGQYNYIYFLLQHCIYYYAYFFSIHIIWWLTSALKICFTFFVIQHYFNMFYDTLRNWYQTNHIFLIVNYFKSN